MWGLNAGFPKTPYCVWLLRHSWRETLNGFCAIPTLPHKNVELYGNIAVGSSSLNDAHLWKQMIPGKIKLHTKGPTCSRKKRASAETAEQVQHLLLLLGGTFSLSESPGLEEIFFSKVWVCFSCKYKYYWGLDQLIFQREVALKENWTKCVIYKGKRNPNWSLWQVLQVGYSGKGSMWM